VVRQDADAGSTASDGAFPAINVDVTSLQKQDTDAEPNVRERADSQRQLTQRAENAYKSDLKLPIGAEFEHRSFWGRIRGATKKVLCLDRGGRDFPLFPDDTFLVSYPRSGNTWARFLIANLLDGDSPITFANIDRKIPEPAAVSRRQLARVPRPRIIKSHEYFDPRYRRLIYIVRDPRDVAVSNYYFQLKKRFIPDGYPMDEYISLFVSTGIDVFASWAENVTSWIATRGTSRDFLLLKYEEMTKEPERELSKIASFLGIPAAPERLARAVELSSPQRMRELEKQETDVWQVTRNTRKDIPFVRDAKSGAWGRALSKNQLERIESAWAPIMVALGYEPTLVNRAKPDPLLASSLPRQFALERLLPCSE